MQGYNLTPTSVKLLPMYTECGRSLSPTFDLQDSSGNTLLYSLVLQRNWGDVTCSYSRQYEYLRTHFV